MLHIQKVKANSVNLSNAGSVHRTYIKYIYELHMKKIHDQLLPPQKINKKK